MTTTNVSKPESDNKSNDLSATSPVKNDIHQKTTVDSMSQATDASQADGVSDSDSKKYPKIREHDDRKIFVGNLPVQVEEPELIDHFSQAGKVEYVTIIRTRNGTPRRYGFIVFANRDDSIKAVDTLNNVPFLDSPLVVQSIVPRPRRSYMRRRPRRYSSRRRRTSRRGRSFDQAEHPPTETGHQDEVEETSARHSPRFHSRRPYNDYGRPRRRYPTSRFAFSRQDNDEGFANTQGTQTHDAHAEGPNERKRSQSYGRRRRSYGGQRRPYYRRSRGEESGFASSSPPPPPRSDYNDHRGSPRREEHRGRRGNYGSNPDYGYATRDQRFRRSQERESYRGPRRNGPPPSSYNRRRFSRPYPNSSQSSYDSRSGPSQEQFSEVGVFVGNLPYRVNKDSLANYFSEKGYSVHDAYVVRDHYNNSRGYGFVEFESHEDQQKAIHALDGSELEDRVIAIKPAVISRRDSEGFGGPQQHEE